jgi:hypothetical protein
MNFHNQTVTGIKYRGTTSSLNTLIKDYLSANEAEYHKLSDMNILSLTKCLVLSKQTSARLDDVIKICQNLHANSTNLKYYSKNMNIFLIEH